MKYNDNGEIKELKIKAVLPLDVENQKSTSTEDVYSCKYVNDELDTKADTSDVPTKVSELENDSGYVTTDTTYTAGTNVSISDSNVISGKSNSSIVDLIYPVGAIYMSVNSTNPGTLFGGTWVEWGAGKVPVGVNTSETEFNAVEKTGGEKTHKLTVNEMPSHAHNTSIPRQTGSPYFLQNVSATNCYVYMSDGTYTSTNTGGGQAHNNLQPYITCYMWKRTN